MKKALTAALILTAVALFPTSSPAQAQAEDAFPPGLINLNAVDTLQVLDLYRTISGFELVISSHVKNRNARLTLQPTVQLKRSEALKLFERAFIEQTGIVITRLDDKRASVTYNDALPTKPVTDARPLPQLRTKDGLPLAPPNKPVKP